jgi:hypothetical protein
MERLSGKDCPKTQNMTKSRELSKKENLRSRKPSTVKSFYRKSFQSLKIPKKNLDFLPAITRNLKIDFSLIFTIEFCFITQC